MTPEAGEADPLAARHAERVAFVRAEIDRRLELLERCNESAELQQAAIIACGSSQGADGCLRWFRDFVWTYDPRARAGMPRRLPFRLWPRQEELVRFLVAAALDGHHGLVKKGRDVGYSWITMGVTVWLWLFCAEYKVTVGSRRLDLVDELGNPDALLPKARQIVAFLPDWMRPPDWDVAKFGGYRRIRNPWNGSLITGESGDNAGRGGRAGLYLADEWAFVPRAQTVNAAVMDNSDAVIKGSTSNGMGTQFHRDEIAGGVPVFRINYRDDPWKAPHDEWRRRKLLAYAGDEAQFAREHEMDDSAALDGLCIPAKWVQAATRAKLRPRSPVVIGFDVALSGGAESVAIPRRGPRASAPIVWTGADIRANADRALAVLKRERARWLVYDADGIGATLAGEWSHARARANRQGATLPRHGAIPFNGGAAASELRYFDDAGRSSARDRFRNARTEAWYRLRVRFAKTYARERYRESDGAEGRDWPESECIAIPRDETLITQLSTPLLITLEDGTLALETKAAMAKRNVPSPDRADALAYAFYIVPVAEAAVPVAEPELPPADDALALVERLRAMVSGR